MGMRARLSIKKRNFAAINKQQHSINKHRHEEDSIYDHRLLAGFDQL